jgi:hypothetical protein
MDSFKCGEPIVVVLTKSDTWDDNVDYHFAGDGEIQLLRRRKCGFTSCQKTTQLELCSLHLLDVGLEVKESQIPNSGWGLFTTRDRKTNEFICNFTGTEINRENFTGCSEYLSWKGGGIFINSSIERCSAACANSLRSNNNCSLKLYKKQCCIRAKKPLSRGDEIHIAYGRTYRWI